VKELLYVIEIDRTFFFLKSLNEALIAKSPETLAIVSMEMGAIWRCKTDNIDG
jgi:hypothetical protein